VKKPVDFGFLDFSSLEKREFYCREEIRLNRRLCADTYRRVVPVSRSGGKLHFGEGDEIVDYAVEMTQLEASFFMNRMVDENRVTHDDIARIVRTLYRFYESQRGQASLAKWGRPEHLKISTDENFEQTKPYVDRLITRPAFDAVRYFTDRCFALQHDLFERRCEEGHILDCHGDLHLDHVHLSPGGVCIYDCIEFNERFRYIDVANDAAFLSMDLELNGAHALSDLFLEQIATKLSDPDLLNLQPFYRCYRAYVRGKVEAMKSAEDEVMAADRENARESARRHFNLATRYAIGNNRPFVLIVMGSVGAGKSTQALKLGDALGWPVLSSDRVRKELAGVPLYHRGGKSERDALYRSEMTDRTYAALMQRAIHRLQRRQGVLLDATYSRRSQRDALRAALDGKGFAWRFVILHARDEVIRRRLADRETEPAVVSDARLEDWEQLAGHFEAPDHSEDRGLVEVDASLPEQASTAFLLKRLVDGHLEGV
jgi:aminoglycoside phosphotransferase family enzyme/predicted kinase